jgi:hypothetical protein
LAGEAAFFKEKRHGSKVGQVSNLSYDAGMVFARNPNDRLETCPTNEPILNHAGKKSVFWRVRLSEGIRKKRSREQGEIIFKYEHYAS